MTDRIRLDDLTSDQLDALYERLEAAEDTESQQQLATARNALALATTRAARAEAALARIRDAAALHRQQLLTTTELYAVIEAALDEPSPAAAPEQQP
ncbi:hypothetical protein ACH40E_03020 [Streptomyces acidicola]|uniref:hypothetical protein n=1 Tax=Streptomyces acidicola TaxID=2596892 RepID=UPI0037B15207